MALSDLAVFSEFVYESQVEVLAQQIELFNAAAQGTIILRDANHAGDYSDAALWARVAGLVRRRNAYGTGNVTEKVITQLTDTMVKVAAGTPPVRIDPGMFEWINADPELAGTRIGQQLAEDLLQDMLNTGVMCCLAALSGQSAVVLDYSGTGDADFPVFNLAAAKFGDRSTDLRCWIMHSKVLFDIYGTAMANAQGLFTYGTVNVVRDPFGRPFIVSDIPAMIEAGTPNHYLSLGLTAGAITIDRNDDFTDNVSTDNGKENITRTYQAEWSYNAGIKGFAWDKTNGGKSPTDAALATATNWDKFATSNKDLAGVLIETT